MNYNIDFKTTENMIFKEDILPEFANQLFEDSEKVLKFTIKYNSVSESNCSFQNQHFKANTTILSLEKR